MLTWFHPSEEIAMSLSELRQACGLLTQAKVGARMGTSQSAVANFEGRDDALISKLRDFVEALGGELEITAKFRSGHRVRLKQFTRERAPGRRFDAPREVAEIRTRRDDSIDDDDDGGGWTVVR